MGEFESSLPLPTAGDRTETKEPTADNARLRNEAWASLNSGEKIYFAKLYFELLDVGRRDEVWGFCSPEDRFAILSQPHYWSAVEDESRDGSLGFVKERDCLEYGAYFNLLTNDDQKNEAWALLPAPTANDWHWPWGPRDSAGTIGLETERLEYFNSIALEDWRGRIGSHETEEGELWEALDAGNRRKYFDFFPSFCNSDQKSEVWRRLDNEEKALLVARDPFHWTAFMLFKSKGALHSEEKDEAWGLLDDESKVYVMATGMLGISDAQRDEAWALANREVKVVTFTDWSWRLSDEQKQEAWASMTRKEKKYARALGLSVSS